MRSQSKLQALLRGLLALPKETEWIEFKHNDENPIEIGQYISALANSAALFDQKAAYICWGIEDGTHRVLGTKFKLTLAKEGGQELENWLAIRLKPRIDFRFHEFEYHGKPIAMIEVPCATHLPVKFRDTGYIRIGSYKKLLKEHEEKEKALWGKLAVSCFETSFCERDVQTDDVLKLIDYPGYFDLTGQPLPDNRVGILSRLCDEGILSEADGESYDISNLSAMLFAKDLRLFPSISRKAPRVIVYRGTNRAATESREQEGIKGYAVGFAGIIQFIMGALPHNEQIVQAFRTEVSVYPSIAIREGSSPESVGEFW